MADRVLLASFADVKRTLDALQAAPPTLTGPFSLGTALAHCAQSVRCSLHGYPRLRSAFFRATLGRLGLRKFLRQGFMSHDRGAPIPGAPPLRADLPLADGLRELRAALAEFERHPGPFAPHLAFGPLTRDEYERIHAMHLADHLSAR